ncbi:unnamed protein product [marine sediment metagenome]|uniref:Replication-associated protein ORF2/G2P domain-containing protein n=1 Tax=marine sediment metagenome TaxID=412755 RepID=X1KK67_9ZZZZ
MDNNSRLKEYVKIRCPGDTSKEYVQSICPDKTSKKYVKSRCLCYTSKEYVQGACPVKGTCPAYKEYVNPVRMSWMKTLDFYDWSWFATLTFAKPPKTYTAIHAANQWLKSIERQEKRKIGYYIALEYTRLGTPHFHALIGNLERIRRLTWMDNWKFGYARIYPYHKHFGVEYYLSKYVIKDSYESGWFDIKGLQYLNQQTL